MINWFYFPKSDAPPELCAQVVSVFQDHEEDITSDRRTLDSNGVLLTIARDLSALGFSVESGKKKHEKVSVPVLFGVNGKIEKSFGVDAWHRERRFVIEVEAGRATVNHQFLKDLFEACMMQGVDYFCVAVRNMYLAAGIKNPDFDRVVTFFETLYASRRLQLPLKGVLVIGY
ncbi:MAG TPA: hypothetical protein VF017_13435 [Thermoanaerobaculia bacterium]|nr:hypothetical protein [Thermoanaerobaculia bacterium]